MAGSVSCVVRALFPLLCGLVLLGCAKPDLDECRRACWNYNRVAYWAQVDREVRDMPSGKAAKYRAAKEIEFKKIQQREEDQGLMNCIYDCQHNSNEKQISCMKNASTQAQLDGCME